MIVIADTNWKRIEFALRGGRRRLRPQHRIMRLLVKRVQLQEDGLDIIWRDDSWQRFRRELERQPFVAEQREQAMVSRD